MAESILSELPLDAAGTVPWWGDKGDVTLHAIAVHMLAELNRHAGHADIVRESIDGATMYPLMAAAEGWPATDRLQPWQPA